MNAIKCVSVLSQENVAMMKAFVRAEDVGKVEKEK